MQIPVLIEPVGRKGNRGEKMSGAFKVLGHDSFLAPFPHSLEWPDERIPRILV